MTPSIGRIVHYVSYGTPGGEFPATCRAAIVAAVDPGEVSEHGDACDLVVLNPEGIFFNHAVRYSDPVVTDRRIGGTWHWPERVE